MPTCGSSSPPGHPARHRRRARMRPCAGCRRATRTAPRPRPTCGRPCPGCGTCWHTDARGDPGRAWGGNMEVPAMLRRSVEEFSARVSQIRDDQWEAGTPDTEWNVRDLVNHVLAENLWAPPLLAGSTISDVGDRFDGDVLGPDPKGSWLAASGYALAGARDQRARGDLHRRRQLPAGPL